MSSTWTAGDAVSMNFPVALHLDQVKGVLHLVSTHFVALCWSLTDVRIRYEDDRHEYSSLHAVFFGPFLLAGMTDQNWRLGVVDTGSPSSWISPVPKSYVENLYSFTQPWSVTPRAKPGREGTQLDEELVMGHRNGSVAMTSVCAKGTNEAAHSTFRVAPAVDQSSGPVAGIETDLVSLELYSQPGKFIAHRGAEREITVAHWFGEGGDQATAQGLRPEHAVFKIRPGLSGKSNTVSFEAASSPGCFLSTCLQSGGIGIKLSCSTREHDENFHMSASFGSSRGLSEYHPLSFIATGPQNQFLLFPLSAYEDERYTTYFDLS